MRGEQSGTRVAYLHGELELMSPSIKHELLKKMLARLLEAYAEERGIELNGYGSGDQICFSFLNWPSSLLNLNSSSPTHGTPHESNCCTTYPPRFDERLR